MKVLHVITSLDPLAGGTTAALSGMARAQAAAGLQPHVLATYTQASPGSIRDELEAAGVGVTLIGPAAGPLRRHADLPSTARRLVQEHDVTHVHALWEEPQHQACLAAHRADRPLMLSPHGMLDAWSLAQSAWKKRIYRAWRLNKHLGRADALHLTTPAEAESVARLGLPGTRVVVPLGLDLHEFDPLPPAGGFRARYPALGDRPFVLFLSRLHHKKGLGLLLDAYAQITRGPDARAEHLVIAGPPDTPAYLAELQGRAQALGVTDRVHFVGMQHGSERVQAMVDAQLFVLPSHQENFGIVVPEAGAAGLPLLVSEHVNLCDFVRDQAIGDVLPLDTQAWADTMRRMLADPTRADTGQRARAAVLQTYDWRRIGPRWAETYRAVLDQRGVA